MRESNEEFIREVDCSFGAGLFLMLRCFNVIMAGDNFRVRVGNLIRRVFLPVSLSMIESER